METISHNVKDLEKSWRESLEQLIGRRLRDDQEVTIQIVDLAQPGNVDSQRVALRRALEIARQGRLNAVNSGLSEKQMDDGIESAIGEFRNGRRSPNP